MFVRFCVSTSDLANYSHALTRLQVRVWDFWGQSLDVELRGHNADVYAVAWHPGLSLLASGSRDTTVKLWDPKAGKDVRTLKAHKNEVLHVSWNAINGGNWLLTASRDQSMCVWDVRSLDAGPVETFVGEHRGVTAAAWHPAIETLFAAGHLDGAMQHWVVGAGGVPQADVPHAHDSVVRDLVWAPSGALLVSVSNDTTTKFWARSRPGDTAAQFAYQGNPVRAYPDRNLNVVPVTAAAAAAALGEIPRGAASSLLLSGLPSLSFEDIEEESKRFVASGDSADRVVAVSRSDFAAAARAAGAPLVAANASSDAGRAAAATAAAAAAPALRVTAPALGSGLQSSHVGGAFNSMSMRGGVTPLAAAGVIPQGTFTRKPPGPTYVCRKCGIAGHWIEECPNPPQVTAAAPRNLGGERPPPGPTYVCRKCESCR